MQTRVRLAGLMIGFVFLMLAGRLWYLQIAKGEYYRQESERNRTRTVRAMAPRGQLLDRKGRILATSRPQVAVAVIPSDLVNPEQTLDRLAGILKTTRPELENQIKLKRESGYPRYLPVIVASDVPIEIISQVREQQLMLPGVELEVNPVRVYPEGLGCHVLGYLSEANETELKLLKPYGYRMGDFVGKAGLEQELGIVLRGEDGGQQVEVDASGRMTHLMGYKAPVPGHTVVLTIDRDVQRAAEKALAGRAGAAVAIDPRNGDVLAMAAAPTFDANAFARGIKPAEWKKIALDPKHPLQNRAIANKFPPGSTFKIITSIAGLETGVITDRTAVSCPGVFYLGRHPFRCWSRHGGGVNLTRAIQHSCDVFYYTMGRRIGPDALVKWCRYFGLEKHTGVCLEGEKRGNLPKPIKPLRDGSKGWYPGQVVNMSIGQGEVLTTPIQMCQVIAAMADWGTFYHPRFVRKIIEPNGREVRSYSAVRTERDEEGNLHKVIRNNQNWNKTVAGKVPASRKNIEKVRFGLLEVVTNGTGKAAKIPNIAVAGKTGSAENPHGRTHAWFVCFAPYEKPTIAICTFVENGGHGGSDAAPIARKMMEAYFHVKPTQGTVAVRGD